MIGKNYIDYSELESFVLDDSYYHLRKAFVDESVSLDDEGFLVELAIIYDKPKALEALFEYGADPWGNASSCHIELARSGSVAALEVCDRYLPEFLDRHMKNTNPLHDFIFSAENVHKESHQLNDLVDFIDKRYGSNFASEMFVAPVSGKNQVELIHGYVRAIFRVNWEPENYDLLISLLEYLPKEYDEVVYAELLGDKSDSMLMAVLSSGLYKLDKKFYASVFESFFDNGNDASVFDINKANCIDIVDDYANNSGAVYSHIFEELYKTNFRGIIKNYDNISWCLSRGLEITDSFYDNFAQILLSKNQKFDSNLFFDNIDNDDRIDSGNVVRSLVNNCALPRGLTANVTKSLKNYLTTMFNLESSSLKYKRIVDVLKNSVEVMNYSEDGFMNRNQLESLEFLDGVGYQEGLSFILKNKFDVAAVEVWLEKVATRSDCRHNGLFLFQRGSIFNVLKNYTDDGSIDLELLKSATLNQNVVNFFSNNMKRGYGYDKSFEKLKEDIKSNKLEEIPIDAAIKAEILARFYNLSNDDELRVIAERFLLDLSFNSLNKKSIKVKI